MKYIMYLSVFCLGFVFNTNASNSKKTKSPTNKKSLALVVPGNDYNSKIPQDMHFTLASNVAGFQELVFNPKKGGWCSPAITPTAAEYAARFASPAKSDALQIPASSGAKKKKSSRAERERKHKLSDEKEHKDKQEHKSDDSDSPTSSDNEPDQK